MTENNQRNQLIIQQSIPIRILVGIFLLSASTLAFEINLTRYLSISQFYHFAFMVVSIALLGYGASGTFLAIFPTSSVSSTTQRLSISTLATSVSILCSYIFVNLVPFDSFSIFIDHKQLLILILHYLVLAAPFFFSGMVVGATISLSPQNAGKTYAANMVGSGVGCGLALLSPTLLGVPGSVMLSTAIAGFASLAWIVPIDMAGKKGLQKYLGKYQIFLAGIILFSILGIIWILTTGSAFSFLEINLSPYKGLSYALQYPGAELVSQEWNAYSRLDVVDSPGIRSLPGVSTKYLQPPPSELGMFIDGENLNPIVVAGEDPDYAPFLPQSIAYLLRPKASTLILGAQGGLDILSALAMGTDMVTAVEVNPLVISSAYHIYSLPDVITIQEADRSYSTRTSGRFDIVIISLTTTFHPIRSGAYSLSEDYRYTVESIQDALEQVHPGGILVFNRWLQNPPSESLRAFTTVVEALENFGFDPKLNIVVFRGYNIATFLVKKQPFSELELAEVENFLREHRFDLIYSPEPNPDLINRYNVLQSPLYAEIYNQFINTKSKDEFYDLYPYDVRPPTDDKPFWGHYFKWSQFSQIISEFRQYWQPFGGAGFLVIFVLLGISILLAAFLIILPTWVLNRRTTQLRGEQRPARFDLLKYLTYFFMLGLGYLLVEIPIIHIFILYLGNPAYAITVVLFSLLVFSGVGSTLSHRINPRLALAFLPPLILLTAFILPVIIDLSLDFPLAMRFFLTAVMLAPLSFFMGIPFPAAIERLPEDLQQQEGVSWFWAANGSASVISAILAALLAISFGYRWVLIAGTAAYFLAFIVLRQPDPRIKDSAHQ